MTTLVNRKVARAALVAMFVAVGDWADVYGHQPATFKRHSPVMTIIGTGTGADMATETVNPTDFIFTIRNYVLMDDKTGVWTTPEAEDELDDLEQSYRQTVRDNQGNKAVTGVDLLTFDSAPSISGTSFISGQPYRTEEFKLHARLPKGS